MTFVDTKINKDLIIAIATGLKEGKLNVVMSRELGIPPSRVKYIVDQMREAGYEIPKRHNVRQNNLRALINEEVGLAGILKKHDPNTD